MRETIATPAACHYVEVILKTNLLDAAGAVNRAGPVQAMGMKPRANTSKKLAVVVVRIG